MSNGIRVRVSLPTSPVGVAGSVGPHAATHATGQSDAISPVSIGAEVAGSAAAAQAAAIAACPAETTSTIGTLVSGATAKATPADPDTIPLSDSAASGILKSLSWSNLKTALASIFARLAGTAGGQTLYGGTAASETLTLGSTSHATKGAIVFGTASEYDEANDRLGIGTTAPSAKVHSLSPNEQLRLGYDVANYASATVSSLGALALESTGGQYSIKAASTGAGATLGAELVTNGDFSSSLSGWTDSGSSWSWSAGTALHTAGSASTLSQNVSVANGSTYQITVTMAGRTAGSVSITLGAVTVVASSASTLFNSNVVYSRTVVAGASGSVALTFTPTSDFDGSIDTISVKLVTLYSVTPSLTVLDSTGSASSHKRAFTSAQNSLGIGLNALRSQLAAATNNVSVGPGSCSKLLGGSYNTLIGSYAGTNITDGSYNTGVGQSSIYQVTTAWHNAALGYSALNLVTTGAQNCAFGNYGLASLTTGGNNSCFGYQALYSLGASAATCAFGYQAGRYLANGSSALTSAGNSVYVGASTKASADSVTNENVFGYNATGIGSNSCVIGSSSVTKCQIYGDLILDKTVTAAGTTGAQTINKTVGSVNFAAGATSLVVTNNRVTTASVIVATVATNDSTMKSVIAVAASGSFTLTANAAATAETRVNFIVIN